MSVLLPTDKQVCATQERLVKSWPVAFVLLPANFSNRPVVG